MGGGAGKELELHLSSLKRIEFMKGKGHCPRKLWWASIFWLGRGAVSLGRGPRAKGAETKSKGKAEIS